MSNTPKFRLRLNLFDGIILVLAVVAAAVLVYLARPAQDVTVKPDTTNITYTIRLQNAVPQLDGLISTDDAIEDAVKNLALGTVVSATAQPATVMVLDEENLTYKPQPNSDLLDVDIVVSSPANISDEAITLTSGYLVRCGDAVYVRGAGYLGSGIILNISREGIA